MQMQMGEAVIADGGRRTAPKRVNRKSRKQE